MRILVVEDEKRLAKAVAEILRGEKYMVDVVSDGREALDYGEESIYDAIVLDVMLPYVDGYTVAKKLRERKVETPILILTAKDEITDKVSGLDVGADDYMTKPFVAEELLARIRAITRRKGEVILEQLEYKGLSLDMDSGTISKDRKSVRLNFKEFELMKLFMSNPKTIYSKETLITKIWGYDSDATDNNVEAYISFLRKKLTHIGADIKIEAIRKVGYKLC